MSFPIFLEGLPLCFHLFAFIEDFAPMEGLGGVQCATIRLTGVITELNRQRFSPRAA